MSKFPKKTTKRVKIVEEHNTYYTMESDESNFNAIASEVKSLFELEKTSDESREAATKELQKLGQDRNEKEHKIEQLLKQTGLHRKNFELGYMYISELVDLTYKINETFQSVRSTIQQRKEVLLSIKEIDKEVHSRYYLNKLSLERLQGNFNKNIEDQARNIDTIENEIVKMKQFEDENVNRLSAQIDELKEELAKRKVDVEEITQRNDQQEKEHKGLVVKLKDVKTSTSEASLDIQETNLRRDGMIADINTFERIYEGEMKDSTGKYESVSESVLQHKENCKKLDDDLQKEKAISAVTSETKNQLEKASFQLSEEIKKSNDLYTKINEQKQTLLKSAKIEETNEEKLKEDVEMLRMEISTKDNELQSLNQLKQIEEKLKSELDGITNTINTGIENSSALNNSIEELKQEKKMAEETIDKLETSIQETELKVLQIHTQDVEYGNELEKETLELEKALEEMKEKSNTNGTVFPADYENMKADFKNEAEELDKRHATEIIDLNKSTGELQNLFDDSKQSIKLLENNLEGTQSECDVISRKILMLERSMREEKRPKIPVIPVVKKRSIDMMSDSSDDRPSILEIFKKKREAEMRKEKGKKNRNKNR